MSTYCDFAPGHPVHGPYHDHEYGVPTRDESALFERLILEINQAGLSWETILKKREGFRRAYDGFDVDTVAAYGDDERARLLADPGIIRNRLKVHSARNNARATLKIIEEFGSLDAYFWGFVDGKPIRNRWHAHGDVPARTPLSDKLSKDLQKRGFNFVGSTIIYAHMQATGMVNDHLVGCFRHKQV